MKITFLGTGTSQGVPVIGCNCEVCKSEDPRDNRLRTSLLITIDNKNILIDAGPDFRMQMLQANVSDLSGILITHEHKDHVGGLDDVRALNYIQHRPMDIYCERRVGDALRNEYSYVFAKHKYPGIPQFNLKEIELDPFKLDGIEIIPIRAFHHKLPVLGFRIEDLCYLTDINFIPEEEKSKIIGSKYIIIDALRKQKHISHFSLSEAIKTINEFSPRKSFLIHMSHKMGLHAEVSKELPQNIELAYDGQIFDCR